MSPTTRPTTRDTTRNAKHAPRVAPRAAQGALRRDLAEALAQVSWLADLPQEPPLTVAQMNAIVDRCPPVLHIQHRGVTEPTPELTLEDLDVGRISRGLARWVMRAPASAAPMLRLWKRQATPIGRAALVLDGYFGLPGPWWKGPGFAASALEALQSVSVDTRQSAWHARMSLREACLTPMSLAWPLGAWMGLVPIAFAEPIDDRKYLQRFVAMLRRRTAEPDWEPTGPQMLYFLERPEAEIRLWAQGALASAADRARLATRIATRLAGERPVVAGEDQHRHLRDARPRKTRSR